MNQQEMQVLLANGEDSLTRFKSPMDNPDQLAAELVAFSNSAGGRLFIGCMMMARSQACRYRMSSD